MGLKAHASTQTPAASNSRLLCRLPNRTPEFIYCPTDFVGTDYCRRGEQQVIAGVTINTALHAVSEHAASGGALGDVAGNVQTRSKRLPAGFIFYKFHAPDQADTAHITH